MTLLLGPGPAEPKSPALGGYGAWPAYVARRRKRPPVRRPGAFGDPVLQAILNMIGSGPNYTQLSDDEIRTKASADANAILGPLLQRQQADYLARIRAGGDVVRGYTSTFADRVGALGPEAEKLFAGDRAFTGAASGGLADAQGGANQQGIDALSAALFGMNAPHAQGTVDQQQALSANGTRLTKVLGADELERLANEGSAVSEMLGKQPGIAGLEGGEILQAFLTQQTSGLNSALADINGQAPGLIQQLVSDYYSRQRDSSSASSDFGLNKAQLVASYLNSKADRDLTANIAGAKLQAQIDQANQAYVIKLASAKTAAERAAVDKWYKQQITKINQQKADASTTQAAAAKTRAAKAGQPKPITWQSVVSDAAKSAKGFTQPGGLFGGSTRPSWSQAFTALSGYLHRKYPKLTPQQVRQAAIAGLRGAGYQRPGEGGATTPAGSVPPPPSS